MKRRNFIQLGLGTTLATLGLNQLQIQQQGLRYAKAIAQNNPRKLALLVGINNYSDAPLSGCITDVYLQRELLVHRFGFNPKDILIVTDDTKIKPTRNGILQAFEEHLIKQAKPSDIVVFHYSGHGSRVIDVNSSDSINSTLVPLDRETKRIGEKRTVSDIMGKTLFLLMSALKTENVTFVLDSCHSGGGKRGNLKIRAITARGDYPSPEELAYQQQWLSRLQMSPQELEEKRQQGIAKGVVISSAGEKQYAADARFDGFSAGAFSYVMTQYLWQEAGNQKLDRVMNALATNTTAISTSRQVPEYEAKGNNSNQPVYFINKQVPPAEAIITKIQGDKVDLWLGGIPPQSLAAFRRDAVFSLVDKQGKPQGLIKLDYRRGVDGIGKILELKSSEALQIGAFLQEQTRIVPSEFHLIIALDNSLSSKNTNNIKERLGIKRLEFITLSNAKEVHYILGKMTPAIAQELSANPTENIPPVGSIGLYGQGLDLIPDSFGNAGESLTDALNRLKTKFRSLLAAKLIKLTLNADSSRLNVTGSMKLKNGKLLAKQFTVRGQNRSISLNEDDAPEALFSGIVNNSKSAITQVRVNSFIEFIVENQENKDLFVTVLVIDPEGTINIIFPNNLSGSTGNSLIREGETRVIPDPNQGDRFKLRVTEPLGVVEVLIIASLSPLDEALKALQGIASRGSYKRGLPVGLEDKDTTDTIDNLLQDLDRGTRGSNNIANNSIYSESNQHSRTIDSRLLAAMSISFEVVGLIRGSS